MLTTVITPILIKETYTYPSENNRSRKIPLPMPLFDAIIKVARVRLKNTNETLADFKAKLRHKFSSIKIPPQTQKVSATYTCVFEALPTPSNLTFNSRRSPTRPGPRV